MKKLLVSLSVITCGVAAASAIAAPTLRVIGSARSSGEFAVAAASASKINAKALYLRGYGRDLSGFGVVACSRGFTSIGSRTTTLKRMVSGRLYRLKQPFAGDCHVTASLSGRGKIKVQILG